MVSGCGKATGAIDAKVVVIVAVLVLLLGGAAWWFLRGEKPEQAIDQFIAAADAKDSAKARSFLSQQMLSVSDDVEKQMSAALGGMLPSADTGMDIAVLMTYQLLSQTEPAGEVTIDGDTATAPRKMKGPMGDMGPTGGMGGMSQNVKLVKENGAWKIDLTEHLQMTAKVVEAMPDFMQGMTEAMQSAAPDMMEGMGEAAGEGMAPASGKNSGTLVAEGTAAKRAGNLEEAVGKFEQALAQDASNVDAHWGLAWVLAAQKKNQQAVSHFEQVIELSDDEGKATEAKAAVERLR